MSKGLVAVSIAIVVTIVAFYFLSPDGGITPFAFIFASLAATFYLLAISREITSGEPLTLRRAPSAYSLVAFWILFLTLPAIYTGTILVLSPLTTASFFFVISLMGLTFTLFYNFVNLPLALHHKRMETRRMARPITSYPMISFIVPAYNEEKCIERTLESLLDIDYPKYEIIVVDDGSHDSTYVLARRFARRGVKVVQRPNGGKARALNLGLFFAKGEIIVTVDADSLVARDSLMELVRLFADPQVMAVAGNVKVLNRVNLLTRLQALEYVRDINIVRRAFDVFGATMVVPGVLGAFRRPVLDDVGSYDPDTVTEDFDTTVKVLKAGSVVQATTFAEGYTEAPEKLGDLYRQRRRWYAGILQTIYKHGDVLRNPRRFGFLSGVGFPYILMSIVFVPIVGFIALASGVIAALTGELYQFLTILAFFVLLETLFSLLALIMDGEDLRLLIFAPLFVIGYRQVRDIIRLKAMLEVIFRRKIGWTRASRMGRAKEMLITET